MILFKNRNLLFSFEMSLDQKKYSFSDACCLDTCIFFLILIDLLLFFYVENVRIIVKEIRERWILLPN